MIFVAPEKNLDGWRRRINVLDTAVLDETSTVSKHLPGPIDRMEWKGGFIKMIGTLGSSRMGEAKFTSLSLTFTEGFSQVVWLIRLLVNTSHQKNIHKLWNKTIGIISLSLERIYDIFRTSLGEIKSSSLIDSNFMSHR